MKWIRLAGIALASLALSWPVGADAPAGMAQALALAWRLSPQAAALDARDAEAHAARDVAAGLTPAPGSISFGGSNDRLNRDQGKREYEVEVTTMLWLPGQMSAHEAEAASRVDEAVARRAALRLALAGEVRDAWWSLAAARHAGALAARRLESAAALAGDVRRRYQAGELSHIDANLAQAEVLIAEAALFEAEAGLLQAEQAFRTLSGVPAPSLLPEERLVMQAAQRPLFDSPETHPQLAASVAAARSARARVKVAEESRRASPELALRVLRERAVADDPYSNSVGVRLKIPFSSGAQVRRETAGAQAEADQAEAEMQRLRSQVQLAAERAQHAWQLAERQVGMAQSRRALSDENLVLGEKSFRLGESDLATLLRLRAAAFDASAFLDRQQVARAAAISQLNQALGVVP